MDILLHRLNQKGSSRFLQAVTNEVPCLCKDLYCLFLSPLSGGRLPPLCSKHTTITGGGDGEIGAWNAPKQVVIGRANAANPKGAQMLAREVGGHAVANEERHCLPSTCNGCQWRPLSRCGGPCTTQVTPNGRQLVCQDATVRTVKRGGCFARPLI